jgi:hypothetical protein
VESSPLQTVAGIWKPQSMSLTNSRRYLPKRGAICSTWPRRRTTFRMTEPPSARTECVWEFTIRIPPRSLQVHGPRRRHGRTQTDARHDCSRREMKAIEGDRGSSGKGSRTPLQLPETRRPRPARAAGSNLGLISSGQGASVDFCQSWSRVTRIFNTSGLLVARFWVSPGSLPRLYSS